MSKCVITGVAVTIIGLLTFLFRSIFVAPVEQLGQDALEFSILHIMSNIIDLIPVDSVFYDQTMIAFVAVQFAFWIIPIIIVFSKS